MIFHGSASGGCDCPSCAVFRAVEDALRDNLPDLGELGPDPGARERNYWRCVALVAGFQSYLTGAEGMVSALVDGIRLARAHMPAEGDTKH